MRARSLLVWSICLTFAGGCGGDTRPSGEVERGVSSQTVERLRDGGHFIVFRHAATDSGVDTTDDLSDCSRQRNLSAEGREQSRGFGRDLDRLRIRIGRVLASPFCRTRDTARIAFGRVRTRRALLSAEFFATPRAARRRGLRSLLEVPPRHGTNTVLVTHGSTIEGAIGVNPEEGGSVVVAPRRRPPGFRVVESVAPDGWAQTRKG